MSELMEIPLERRDTCNEVEPPKHDAERQSAHRMNGNRLCCKSREWFTMYDDNLALKQHIRERGYRTTVPSKTNSTALVCHGHGRDSERPKTYFGVW